MWNKAILILVLLLAACAPKNPATEATPAREVLLKQRPKNVILMVGDGMGLSQITAGMYANNNKLQLERCTVTGIHKPYSADDLITDSAAGATAFASGKKTHNGAVGVDINGKPVRSILEEASQHGLATGLITTSSITHATPAAFIAHVPSRDQEEDIALFFVDSGIDLFIGGGKKFFDRREKDTKDLVQSLRRKGFFISHYAENDLEAITLDPGKPFGYFTADNSPLTVESGRDYLEPATRMALPFLAQRSARGFFIMIEGAQIDWGGHSNETNYILQEMLEFDRIIGTVLDFAAADGRTLVIITADHETGGFAVNPGSSMDTIVGAFTTDQHTAALIPVFAFGPGAELFSGTYENTAIYHKMRQALGFEK